MFLVKNPRRRYWPIVENWAGGKKRIIIIRISRITMYLAIYIAKYNKKNFKDYNVFGN